MVRTHGEAPYRVVVLHGGPGAVGSVFGLAALIATKTSCFEPMQSRCSIETLIQELKSQIAAHCSEKVVLMGHSWGAWLAGLFAQRCPELVEKVILVGCEPLDERYVPMITERRKANMSA